MAGKYNRHFVADGCERAQAAALDEIRATVEREYAERLQSAGWFKRMLLYREMRREIKRRLDRTAPPWGLYNSANR